MLENEKIRKERQHHDNCDDAEDQEHWVKATDGHSRHHG